MIHDAADDAIIEHRGGTTGGWRVVSAEIAAMKTQLAISGKRQLDADIVIKGYDESLGAWFTAYKE
jgi:hypothetical protein